MFVIDDDMHAQTCGEFESFEAALAELRRRAELPWDSPENRCPCQGWRACVRHYRIVEYDDSQEPWAEIGTTDIVDVSAGGVRWVDGFGRNVGPQKP